MPQQPVVTWTNEERAALEAFVHRRKANARTLTRARMHADVHSPVPVEQSFVRRRSSSFTLCVASVTSM